MPIQTLTDNFIGGWGEGGRGGGGRGEGGGGRGEGRSGNQEKSPDFLFS